MQESVLQSVGRTPLIRLRRLAEGVQAKVGVKVESLNPGGSVKDRVGVAMVVFMLFAGAFYMNAMGGGDVKLAGALALWFTPYETLTMIVIMSIAGGLLTLVVVAIHKIKRKVGRPEVPYGVAIAVGGMWLLAQRFLNHFA